MRDNFRVENAILNAIERISRLSRPARQFLSFYSMTEAERILVIQYYTTLGITNSCEMTRMNGEKLLYLTLTTGYDVFQIHSYHCKQWLFQISPTFHHLHDPFRNDDLELLLHHDNLEPDRVRFFFSNVGLGRNKLSLIKYQLLHKMVSLSFLMESHWIALEDQTVLNQGLEIRGDEYDVSGVLEITSKYLSTHDELKQRDDGSYQYRDLEERSKRMWGN